MTEGAAEGETKSEDVWYEETLYPTFDIDPILAVCEIPEEDKEKEQGDLEQAITNGGLWHGLSFQRVQDETKDDSSPEGIETYAVNLPTEEKGQEYLGQLVVDRNVYKSK